VVNFPPKQVGPIRSEFLLTGFVLDTGEVVLAVPDKKVPKGLKLV
jgi:tRNA-binding protein